MVFSFGIARGSGNSKEVLSGDIGNGEDVCEMCLCLM